MPKPLRRLFVAVLAMCWGLVAHAQDAPGDVTTPLAPETPSNLATTNVFVIAAVVLAVAAIVVALLFRRHPESAHSHAD